MVRTWGPTSSPSAVSPPSLLFAPPPVSPPSLLMLFAPPSVSPPSLLTIGTDAVPPPVTSLLTTAALPALVLHDDIRELGLGILVHSVLVGDSKAAPWLCCGAIGAGRCGSGGVSDDMPPLLASTSGGKTGPDGVCKEGKAGMVESWLAILKGRIFADGVDPIRGMEGRGFGDVIGCRVIADMGYDGDVIGCKCVAEFFHSLPVRTGEQKDPTPTARGPGAIPTSATFFLWKELRMREAGRKEGSVTFRFGKVGRRKEGREEGRRKEARLAGRRKEGRAAGRRKEGRVAGRRKEGRAAFILKEGWKEGRNLRDPPSVPAPFHPPLLSFPLPTF